MPLFDNENRILQMEAEKQEIFQYMEDPLIRQPFTEDFVRSFRGVQTPSRGIPCRWKRRSR